MIITEKSELKKYYTENRIWQGISSIEVTDKGRIFVTFYSGGTKEGIGNYSMIIVSDDGGETFSEPILVAYEDNHRHFDPCLWIDPDGRLWFTYTKFPDDGLYAVICDNPDGDEIIFGEEFFIAHDVMMNKPIVLKSGEWAFPVSVWDWRLVKNFPGFGEDNPDKGTFVYTTADKGKTFGKPEKLQRLETRTEGIRTVFAVVTEYYSAFHKVWFNFGSWISYADDNRAILAQGIEIDISQAGFALRDVESGHYISEVQPVPMPFAYISIAPHGQVLEYENGDFLMTFHAVREGDTETKVLAVRYRYENGVLSIVKAGALVALPEEDRLVEPSVAKLGERYYLTLRTDAQGYLSVSDDGFAYAKPIPWKWDDGSLLENYNTMQRWIRHKDHLYLAYTRRGAHNDHVFRHRAPVFMARFDETRMCLVRESEIILVPEHGARLGNFTVTEFSEKEFWLLTAEWMQPAGCEKYGSDNAIWIAKIRFGDRN